MSVHPAQMGTVQCHDVSSLVEAARVSRLNEYGSTLSLSRPPRHVETVVKRLQLRRLALINAACDERQAVS